VGLVGCWYGSPLCQRGSRIYEHPLRLPSRMFRNIVDLFRPTYWPGDFRPLSTEVVLGSAFVYLFVLVIPGLLGFLALRPLRLHRSDAETGIFLYATWCGVVAMAALTLAEPRYRFPFDGILAMCGAFALRRTPLNGRSAPMALRRSALPYVIVGGVALVTGALIVTAASPSMGLASLVARHSRDILIQTPRESRSAAAFTIPVAAHTAWNAPGNFIFECADMCPELLLRLDRQRYGDRVEVSVDNNDRYLVTAYKNGSAVARGSAARTDDGPGLRIASVELIGDLSQGYDAIGVLPTFGDGAYSLGHVRVLE
jgi:hypothetical protein